VVAAAARQLTEVLADPVIARARRSAWLGRDVPSRWIAGRVQEDTLDLVFEEAGELIVVRFDDEPSAPAAPVLPVTALAQTLGRPVRETRVLSLTGP
jgi:hypothetical protein